MENALDVRQLKVMIIGLDGATWKVLDDGLLNGYMPALAALRSDGCWGTLRSTEPPVTPAAWTSCITGCHPYTHGVIGFKDFCFRGNCLRISSSASCRVPTIWQQLGDQGYKVASINVPWTYPCRQVNGVVAAGYGMPGTGASFTFPEDFKSILLKKIPDYAVLAEWDKSREDSFETFDNNVAAAERCFRQRVETAAVVADDIRPDVMMVQFQDVDLVQHHVWPCLDPATRDNHAARRDRLFAMFSKLDRAVSDLLAMVDRSKCAVVVVSDHGFGPMRGSIRANMFLHEWGYLKFQSPLGRMVRRLRRNLAGHLDAGTIPVEMKSPVDWKRTRAMVVYAAMNGHVYLNVKGRNEHGCVEPGGDYDRAIEDLRGRFMAIAEPATGSKLFERVVTPGELYGRDDIDHQITGDLILVPGPGYIVHQSTSMKGPAINITGSDSPCGCHYGDGIYVVAGPNVKAGRRDTAHIVDIAPTVYALLGADIPPGLDGRVLMELFLEPPSLRTAAGAGAPMAGDSDSTGLSETEQEVVARRLAELGYMD